jgi:hypothetical protein
MRESGSPERLDPRGTDCGRNWECRAAQVSAKAMSASKSGLAMIELPGVIESGILRKNGQRKPGTTRGSPRRSRTAKALRISRYAVKSLCARGWGGWGRLSDDGSRQHNSDRSEDPGRRTTPPPRRRTIQCSARHSARLLRSLRRARKADTNQTSVGVCRKQA